MAKAAEGHSTSSRGATRPAWSLTDGRLSIRHPGEAALAIVGAGGSVTVDGRCLSLDEATAARPARSRSPSGQPVTEIAFAWNHIPVTWTWQFEETGDALLVTARLRNGGQTPVAASDWNVLHIDKAHGGTVNLGRESRQVRFFGWRPWDMRVERLGDEAATHMSNNLCHLYDPDSRTTLLCGFVTLDRMLVNHRLDYTPDDGVREYRATCRFGCYDLPAGEELISETLHIACYDDPYAALDAWAGAVYDRYHPTFETLPPVTYGATSWMHIFDGQEGPWADILLENARAVREKLAGFRVDNLGGTTHTLYRNGIPGNWYEVNEKQFPDGLEPVMEELRKMGFAHKFWFSPFWFFAEVDGVLDENRENLLRDRNGSPITQPGNWEWDMNADADDSLRLTQYYLDGTHPKTQDYVRRIFRRNRALGVRAYMLDFLAIKENARLHDSRLLPVQAARQVIGVLREAAGDDTHLQTAVASTPGFIGLINAARVVRDFGESRPMNPTPNWRNATYCLHDEHFANTHSFVQNTAASWFTHRKVYINDLNALTIDKPVPLEHARIAVTMFGLGGGSPVALDDDLRRIDPERLRMIKLCLPRTQSMPVPVDLFDRVWPDDYCRVMKLPVETLWDSYLLAAVYNGDKVGWTGELDFSRLGLDGDTAYRVFDFWNGEYLGTFRGRVTCTVPPAAIRVYRISRARPHPWLLSTDMHLQQGAVEVQSLHWNPQAMTLSGTAARPAGEVGSLFVHVPRRLELVNHRGVGLMKDVRDMTVVARVPICFDREHEDFDLHFSELQTRYVTRKGWLPYATEDEWLAWAAEQRTADDTRVIE